MTTHVWPGSTENETSRTAATWPSRATSGCPASRSSAPDGSGPKTFHRFLQTIWPVPAVMRRPRLRLLGSSTRDCRRKSKTKILEKFSINRSMCILLALPRNLRLRWPSTTTRDRCAPALRPNHPPATARPEEVPENAHAQLPLLRSIAAVFASGTTRHVGKGRRLVAAIRPSRYTVPCGTDFDHRCCFPVASSAVSHARRHAPHPLTEPRCYATILYPHY